MSRETGNPLNWERLSGRIHFKPVGDNGYIDLGDVSMFKSTPETDTVSAVLHTRAATEREVRRDTKSSTQRWEVECQEHTLDNEALLLLGKVGPKHEQAAVAAGATITLSDVKPGRTYPIGKLKILELTAAVGVTAKIVGRDVDGEVEPANADLVVDYELGRVKIREGGTIADGADVELTYEAAEVEMDTIIEVGKHTLRRGHFLIDAFDGESAPARFLLEFDGQLVPKDRGEHKTDSHNKFSFEIIATGDVAVKLAA